jgi:hypothetical protein
MKLKVFKALWGMEGTLESQFEKIAKAGYTGIESPMPDPVQEPLFHKLLSEYRFEYNAMVFTDGDHKESFSVKGFAKPANLRRLQPLVLCMRIASGNKSTLSIGNRLATDKSIVPAVIMGNALFPLLPAY